MQIIKAIANSKDALQLQDSTNQTNRLVLSSIKANPSNSISNSNSNSLWHQHLTFGTPKRFTTDHVFLIFWSLTSDLTFPVQTWWGRIIICPQALEMYMHIGTILWVLVGPFWFVGPSDYESKAKEEKKRKEKGLSIYAPQLLKDNWRAMNDPYPPVYTIQSFMSIWIKPQIYEYTIVTIQSIYIYI